MTDLTFEEACNALDQLCTKSNGDPIEITPGYIGSFKTNRRYFSHDLADLEKKLGLHLPASYSKFLCTVGSISCYGDQLGLFTEFLGPEQVRPWMDKVYAGAANPYPDLLLVVSCANDGTHCGFSSLVPSADNFGVFDSASPCEDWPSEALVWSSFEEWLPAFVTSGGNPWARPNNSFKPKPLRGSA